MLIGRATAGYQVNLLKYCAEGLNERFKLIKIGARVMTRSRGMKTRISRGDGALELINRPREKIRLLAEAPAWPELFEKTENGRVMPQERKESTQNPLRHEDPLPQANPDLCSRLRRGQMPQIRCVHAGGWEIMGEYLVL